MTTQLEWTRKSASHYWAADNAIRYVARMDKTGKWRVRMNGELIGESDGFASFEGARLYVEWGGKQSRMGYDRETGEVQ